MENKPAQNIQDTFLNTVRKDKTPITIYLVSGVKLTGKIRSFDKYSVLLENNSQEQLIFKHAISTVVSNRSVMHTEHRPGWRLPDWARPQFRRRPRQQRLRNSDSTRGAVSIGSAEGDDGGQPTSPATDARRASGGLERAVLVGVDLGTPSRSARTGRQSARLAADKFRRRPGTSRRSYNCAASRHRRTRHLRMRRGLTPKSPWPSFASWFRAPAAWWRRS